MKFHCGSYSFVTESQPCDFTVAIPDLICDLRHEIDQFPGCTGRIKLPTKNDSNSFTYVLFTIFTTLTIKIRSTVVTTASPW